MSQYQDYPKVWATPYQESLFVVKIPAAINTLDEQTYKILMQLRVSWLIQRWMEEEGNTQTEIQQLLATALSQLHPSQDHPLLNQDSSGEAIDWKEWRDSWAAAFILYNERFSSIGSESQRQEILDWFHLKENLYTVNAPEQDLETGEAFLWQGKVDDAIGQLSHWQDEQAKTFIGYLTNHRSRIVNYAYFQAEGISIGSGTIESTVKQIGARIKLSGAQWKSENVPQVLRHRCAYLNGQFSI